ncbi:cupin domain-containing protein [Kibdelosporangium aridum]|uniref:Cupin domain-containing protein n=1 Tax=Kibdelosporangium aridum TaxID=2030 RepID=A0A1W2FLH7_KIBAR|nr:cupin domain-containing protein [Kibdelosporangium aridum]SMD22448.1 Cupin domain-containing protein [Kibdelosporangium aridum]
MRDDYLKGVLSSEKKNRDASEIAARDEFNRQHPPIKGLVVPHDLRKMDLPERKWRNNRGRWFDLADYEVLNAHLAELKPGSASVRHRHTTEAYLYIVKGSGYSLINYDDEPVEVVEWSEGTLFAPPRWAWHQHFNLDENDTSRYLAIQDTGLLRTMRLHNIERHSVQLSPDQGAELLRAAIEQGTVHGGHTGISEHNSVVKPVRDPDAG